MPRLVAVAAALVLVFPIPTSAQEDGIPRMADGRPDLRGVWQALNTAVWNIQDHPAELGILGRGSSDRTSRREFRLKARGG